MTLSYHSSIGLNVYNSIINGNLRPFLPENCKLSKIKNLVRDVNTVTVLKNIDKTKVDKLLNDIDLTLYGYRSMDDIVIDIQDHYDNKDADVIIKPRKPYELLDYIDIPQAPDQKCAYFLTLMADEFERIKIRSNKFLESVDSQDKLSLYANKHIQKTKQLSHDACMIFSKRREKGQFKQNDSDEYILFALNLFLIRLIVYYRKFFKPFLAPANESEEDLRLEFYRSLPPHKKYPYIFRGMPGADCNFPLAEESGIPEYVKKSHLDFSGFDSASTQSVNSGSTPPFSDNKPCSKENQNTLPPKLLWNGQINVLVDIFYQLLNEVKEGDNPILKARPDDVAKMILNNFCDKNGNDLSLTTIKTILQPGRADKRPKASNSKRIDVKRLMPDTNIGNR